MGTASAARRGGLGDVHAAADDHLRLADVEVLPDQRGLACRAFLERAIARCRALCHVPGAPAGAPPLGAVLQPRAPPRQSRLSATAHPAAERCLMNNVFDLNRLRPSSVALS